MHGLSANDVRIRRARPEDAVGAYALIERAGTLELNTGYCYLLFCDHFSDTTIVAEAADRIVGVVIGYRPPSRPDAIFVWQVGVDPELRGAGLGQALLAAFVRTPGAAGARFLEATVTPSNAASRALFRAFARTHDAAVDERAGYAAALMPGEHEPELLLRIGPLTTVEDGVTTPRSKR